MVLSLRRIALSLTLAGLAAPLCGFKLLDPPRAWDDSSWPVEYHLGDAQPNGLNEAEKVDLTQVSFNKWRDVPCSPIDTVRGDDIPNATTPGFGRPNLTILTYNDPGQLLSTGILAAAVTQSNNNQIVSANGVDFFRTTAMNLVYNDGLEWGTPEDMQSGSCFRSYDFVGVSTHEMGHGFGLGHSCDDGEPCSDPLLIAATMYWQGGACDDGQQTPNPDDWAGINAMYGIGVDYEVEDIGGGEAIVGTVPLTAAFAVPDAFGGYDSYTWNFGDGSPMEENLGPDAVEHTWDEEGQFTVTLSITGNDLDCGGDFSAEQRKVGVILACAAPAPTLAYSNEGDFIVQMQNTTPLGAFGCIDGFEWILDGDEDGRLSTYEPKFTFTDAGSHSVVLRASGPGGSTDSPAMTIEVSKASDAGCNASIAGRAGSTGPLALVLLLGALGIRRRD